MIKLSSASLTDTGLQREENEDFLWAQIHAPFQQDPVGLFVVCDGMGGHMGGKFASYWAVEAVRREFAELFVEKDPRATVVLSDEDIARVKAGQLLDETPMLLPDLDLEDLVHSAIQKANLVVHDYARHKPDKAANAGTTITMMVSRGEQAIIANAGDSRTYLIRDGVLQQISRDHSLVASLVQEGHILPNEIYTHPQRNVIYRFLGQRGRVHADIFPLHLRPGDVILLCSDGLWEMLQDDPQIVAIIQNAPDLDAACRTLVDAANREGGEDNISVVLARVEPA